MWESWGQDLRRHVNRVISQKLRDRMKRQRSLSQEPQSTTPATRRRTRSSSQLTTPPRSQPETVSHNWKEGARIGEAQNPEPMQPHPPPSSYHPAQVESTQNRGRNRAPVARSSHLQAPARRHGARAVSQAPQSNAMKQPIGTPGNDGQFSAEDLRPGWRAGSQPESRHPTRGGSSGVRVDHRRGVSQHAVNQARASPPEGVSRKTANRIRQELKDLQEQLQHLSNMLQPQRKEQLQQRTQTQGIRDDNPWTPLQRKSRQ